ncbi:hypothetical protein GCM10009789_23920 [Kribbella sancticallisti]|uniref:DUF998 domain-containing protein n=1 Tax=Kribbella sancticallisti TaxID=460087 RepID=A0ABN2D3N9_9ACTN
MTLHATREDDVVTKARDRAEVVVLVVAAVGLVVFGYLSLGFHSSLPRVDPSQLGHGVTYSGSGLDSQWAWCVLISSVTMIAAAGLPTARLWASRGSIRGAVVQGVGGLVVAGWTGVVSQLTFYFTGPGDNCTYASCWPLKEQAAAFVVPGVLTGIVMIVMACLVNRLPWSVRALTPVVVWIATLLVQHAVWTSYLLPIFEGPPR